MDADTTQIGADERRCRSCLLHCDKAAMKEALAPLTRNNTILALLRRDI